MTPQQRKQAGEDLAAAAAYIREHGWTTGTLLETYGPKRGRVCALGGINAVVMGDPQAYGNIRTRVRVRRATRLFLQRVAACFPTWVSNYQDEVLQITSFNDAQRNKAKVLKVLDGGCES